MNFLTFDCESYFDQEFSLKRLSTEAYVRDSRFECHGAALKFEPKMPARWYIEPELRVVLKHIDWSNTGLIAHHIQFDGLVLAHHYQVDPKMWLCTLAMARLLFGNHLSVSLDSVRKQLGMQPKNTPYDLFRGKHWRDLNAQEQNAIARGCEDECESVWEIFRKLSTGDY